VALDKCKLRVYCVGVDCVLNFLVLVLKYFSASTTLVPGTPHGVGMAAKPTPRWLRSGDSVSIEIEKIGTLTNPVTLEPA